MAAGDRSVADTGDRDGDAEVERFLSDQARGHRGADRHLFFDPVTGRLVAAEHPGADAVIADQTAEDGYFTMRRPR